MAQEPIIIKGCPRDKWEAVQAIQHQPFIYIMGNGSKWAGQEEDDLPVLLDVLAHYRLREDFAYHTVNPCRGVVNPKHCAWAPDGEPAFIDGERLYQCDGVVRFGGNFVRLSHGFSIDTNHQPTIDALIAAMEANASVVEVAA